MENKKKGFIEKIKNIKGIEYIVIAVIAVLIILILFGDGIFGSKKTSASGDYVSSLEQRLGKTLSGIKGAGKVSVAVTVTGGNRTLLATDTTTVKDGNTVETTETTVLVGGKVVVLSELYPEITGVVIVASGADDASVRLNLLKAAVTLLSVDPSRVSILTGK